MNKNKTAIYQAKERKALMLRAYNLTRMPIEETPQSKITTLEKYIERLRELGANLEKTYQLEELGNNVNGIRQEIQRAVSEIVTIQLEMISPDWR
jgi:hypothetical protein